MNREKRQESRKGREEAFPQADRLSSASTPCTNLSSSSLPPKANHAQCCCITYKLLYCSSLPEFQSHLPQDTMTFTPHCCF